MKKFGRICLLIALVAAFSTQAVGCAYLNGLGLGSSATESGSEVQSSSDIGTSSGSSTGALDGVGDSGETIETHDVQVVYNNGQTTDTLVVLDGERILEPKSPTKNNYEFVGWFTDTTWTVAYDFSLPIVSDLVLYAAYEPIETSDGGAGTLFVNLCYNNGKTDGLIAVNAGETVKTPADPKKENYIFVGWYSDAALTKKYDFSKPVTQEITLYAGYELDGVALTNTISTETLKGVVTIYNKNYNTLDSGLTAQGSGFCFHVQENVYYILTNCHVARKQDGYLFQEFTVEDYRGHRYTAELYSNYEKRGDAISADYDLACLYFQADECLIEALEMTDSNLAVGENVISLGAPKNQSNSITYGKLLDYTPLTLSDGLVEASNVKFEVMATTACSNNGSSGGPMLSDKLAVVGVLYAGNTSTSRSYAVPIEKVKEFLNAYVYN